MVWLQTAVLAMMLVVAAASSPCRFAPLYPPAALLTDRDVQSKYLMDVMNAEGQFHTDGVGYNAACGHTYDGYGLDYDSGMLVPGSRHNFSAPSKESLHLAVIALALSGNQYAQQFLIASNKSSMPNWKSIAIQILTAKISTYETFTKTYPGFGYFLPWVTVTDGGLVLLDGWTSQVPALDNGEMIWAMVACIQAMRQAGLSALAIRYNAYLQGMARNAATVFVRGNAVMWVSHIKDVKALPTVDNYYGDSNPGDPYEGELFTVFLDLFGLIPDPDAMWVGKRAMLQAVNYTHIDGEGQAINITVQRGYWYSSHEQWKLAFLPYLDVPVAKAVFANCERVRTLYSMSNDIPGMFACSADVSPPGGPGGYICSGIPNLAFLPPSQMRQDVITPYSIFPTALVNQSVALVWYNHMLRGPKMQNLYGSTEACNCNGTEIAPVMTWDTKITSVVGLLGGVQNLVRTFLQSNAMDDRFYAVIAREYSLVFGADFKESTVEYGLPLTAIPENYLKPFTTCQS